MIEVNKYIVESTICGKGKIGVTLREHMNNKLATSLLNKTLDSLEDHKMTEMAIKLGNKYNE